MRRDADLLRRMVANEPQQSIILKSQGVIDVVNFADVYYIEGNGSYCKVCFAKAGENKEVITSNNISYYEELLPAALFYRIHKSFLVNCAHITHISTDGSYAISVTGNTTIPVSRRRFTAFLAYLQAGRFR